VSLALVGHSSRNKVAVDSKVSILHFKPTYYRSNSLAGDSNDSIVNVQPVIGNQAVRSLMHSDPGGFDFAKISILQPKLKVNQPQDVYEQEADRAAELITNRPKPVIQREPQLGKPSGKMQPIQFKESPDQRVSSIHTMESFEAPAVIHEVLNSSGRPLDSNTRAFFEGQFGYDFSQVRVHNDTRAAESAWTVNALAYTVGNHIVFDKGKYSPQSQEGRRLLAHELAHTVQQEGRSFFFGRRPETGEVSAPHDRQAGFSAAEQVIRDKVSNPKPAFAKLSRLSGFRLQRQPPKISASDDLSGITARLDEIMRTGGPIPTDQTRVIAAAIVDVEGYTGPREIRAISSKDTDKLGKGAAVFHATSPIDSDRSFHAIKGIQGSGKRRDSPNWHKNDAENKIFEYISKRLPPNARGTIHFSTARVTVKGGVVKSIQPVPACSACNMNTFGMAGTSRSVNVVSHAPAHPPMRSADLQTTGGPKTGGGGAATVRGSVQQRPSTTAPSSVGAKAPSSARSTVSKGSPSAGQAYKGEPIAFGSASSSIKARLLATGAQALNSKMFGNIQGEEKNKAEARLAQLWPEIEKLRSQGNGVTVTVLAEVPDQFDIAGAWAGVRDASQLVYYKDMFISSASPMRKDERIINPHSGKANPAMWADLAPKSTPGQQFERQKSRPGWHIESRHLTLPAYPIRESGGINEPTSINKEIAGLYAPVSYEQKPGEAPIEGSYFLNRLLKINYINPYERFGFEMKRPDIKNTIEMWDTDEFRPFTFHNPINASFQLITNGLSIVNNGKFTITKRGSRLPHTLLSDMWYLWMNEVSAVIVEKVFGKSPYNDWSTTSWSAKIIWKKI
jgi:hypothetical protein